MVIATLKSTIAKFCKGCLFSFFQGLSAVFVGLYCILLEIDKEEAKRKERLESVRSRSTAPTTASPGSHVLRDRIRKQRQERLQKESEADSSVSPDRFLRAPNPPEPVSSTLSKFKDAVKRYGVQYLGPIRFSVFLCMVYNLVVSGVSVLGATFLVTGIDHGTGLVSKNLQWFVNLAVTPTLGMLVMIVFVVIKGILQMVEFSDVNNAAANYRDVRGMPKKNFKQLDGVSTLTADIVVSSVTIILIGFQNVALEYVVPVPTLRCALVFLGHCLYHACYAFDYRYMSQGMTQRARFHRIERNWAYYVGFGSPLACITFFSPNPVIGTCIANALYPVLIVGAYLAEPGDETEGVPAIPAFKLPLHLSESLFTLGTKWMLRRITAAPSSVQN